MRLRAALTGLFVLTAASSTAQPATATLTGVVRDPTGGLIAGATVAAEFDGRAYRRVTLTGPEGAYNLLAVAPGRYTITITCNGFAPLTRDDIRMYAGETTRLDAELQIESVSVNVHVEIHPPLPRTEGGSLGHVVDGPQAVSLPLNGRSFVTLATLAPGVALPPGSAFPRINGGRPRTNEYLFDGVTVLQPEPGQVAFLPVVDAIQAFTIESNSPSAEFGRFNGGVINLTTKSGTDTVSGTLFGFLRHEALNARNYFAPDAFRPRFRRLQAGGVIGGPLLRDRTFFFGDYQGQRQKLGRTVISTVPTVLQRQGMFTEPVAGRVPAIFDPWSGQPFPGNTISPERFDAIASALIAIYPLPTSSGTANNYGRTADEVNDQNQFDVRVDQRLRLRGDYAFARFSSFSEHFIPVTPLPDGSGAGTGTPGPQRTSAYSIASSYNAVPSTTIINELRFGDTRRAVDRRAARHDGEILPTYAIAGYQQLGSAANTETEFGTGVRQLTNAISWTRDRHLFKAGFDFRWSRLDVVQPPSPAGVYQFSALFTDLPGSPGTGAPLASFLLGQVQTFSIDVQSQQIQNRAHTQDYFVQDSWRAASRLTVNGGMRYTLNFPSYEQNDHSAVFNLDTQELEYLGREGHPRTARRLHTNNFGPRLGIAARMTPDSVLRAGYAVVWIEQAGITTPFTTPSFPFMQTVTQRTLDNTVPAFILANGPAAIAAVPPTATAGLGQGVFAVDRELGSGYVQQWNVSSQHELWAGAAVELAYIGSKITRVGIPDTNLNQLTVEQLALGPALLERVPNPYFGLIPRSSTLGASTITRAQLMKPFPQYATVSQYRNNVGNTNYHGVTAKLEQRTTGGLSYSIAYTRSRLIDDASSVFDASVLTGPAASYPVADTFNRRLERDYSTGDIPHALVAHAIWEIRRLGGITASAIATFQSGVPLPIAQSTNFNAFAGFGTQRPNVNGDPALPAREQTPERWFNTSAFSMAPQFTLGNSSRNPVRGPAYQNVDLAIARRTPVTRRVSMETRVEVFNLLNTPALGAPNMIAGSPAFGSITSAGDPRVIQLALKLIF